jgi:heterodisulfide reductase subunit C2
MENPANQPMRPQVSLAKQLTKAHLSVNTCFFCRKCSGGCPLTFAMDILPHHVIRLALLGQEEQLLGSGTIWVCSACQTCTTRCPNGIDIAGVMDWLKEEAVKRGRTIPDEEVAVFHRFFLESIQAAAGRVSETRLLRRYTLYKMRRHLDLTELKQNIDLGWKLWKRRRMRLLGPPALRGKAEIKEIFRKGEF